MTTLSTLTDPSLAIVFATAPTGLGHLRVIDALYHGLPKNASPVILGAQSAISSNIYRFLSIHHTTRKAMEMFELPPFDRSVAFLGRKFLRTQTKTIYSQLRTILNERLVVPKTVLLVASHSIIAHQLGQIKDKLARELGVKILLVEQVTDDSPQAIWYIYDADLIFVPSVYTRDKLLSYAKKEKLPLVPVSVIAYPVSPLFAEELTDPAFAKRREQLSPTAESTIHVTVPVPGAAVGTSFMTTYIQSLHERSKRFTFHVISRDAPFTQLFIKRMFQLPYVNLHVSTHDRATVDTYERVFMEHTIALDVTKPSEQAFKALTTPKQRGGALILFSTPVGGQEYDNIHFLRNHELMPHGNETRMLWKLANDQQSMQGSELLEKARHWRCLLLPDDPQEAAAFTNWCLTEKVFATMMHYTHALNSQEVKSNGVEQFWTQVAELVEKTK
jgi:hypothetical protein